MKKVININFQGRVIPIEESAYDVLKVYVESLRRFFANEEGRDEIINDIEGRIAELFGESLKKGSTCITDEDVNTIINSMGRPEDFEGEEDTPKKVSANARKLCLWDPCIVDDDEVREEGWIIVDNLNAQQAAGV